MYHAGNRWPLRQQPLHAHLRQPQRARLSTCLQEMLEQSGAPHGQRLKAKLRLCCDDEGAPAQLPVSACLSMRLVDLSAEGCAADRWQLINSRFLACMGGWRLPPGRPSRLLSSPPAACTHCHVPAPGGCTWLRPCAAVVAATQLAEVLAPQLGGEYDAELILDDGRHYMWVSEMPILVAHCLLLDCGLVPANCPSMAASACEK